jgi:hypothetical protein
MPGAYVPGILVSVEAKAGVTVSVCSKYKSAKMNFTIKTP